MTFCVTLRSSASACSFSSSSTTWRLKRTISAAPLSCCCFASVNCVNNRSFSRCNTRSVRTTRSLSSVISASETVNLSFKTLSCWIRVSKDRFSPVNSMSSALRPPRSVCSCFVCVIKLPVVSFNWLPSSVNCLFRVSSALAARSSAVTCPLYACICSAVSASC